MFSSLRIRLFITFLLVVTMALMLLVVFATQRTASAFDQFRNADAIQNGQMLAGFIEDFIVANGVDVLPASLNRLARNQNREITLVDAENRTIYRAEPRRGNGTLSNNLLPPLTFRIEGTAEVPTVTAVPPPDSTVSFIRSLFRRATPTDQLSPNERIFRTAVTQAFWLAAGIALIFAGILSFWLSQPIINPIRSLTVAARQMQQGDLSQRVVVQGQDEIGKLGEAFNGMASSLQKNEELRRNMVSDIAHELRTPLSNIRGYLEAIQDKVIDPNPPAIHSLYEEAMLLNHLIEDLQELSLAEAGQLRIDLMPIQVIEVIAGAVAGVKMPAANKQITLHSQLPTHLPLVLADAERVGQILRNLLRNAITHTPEGGRITVTAQAQNEFVQVAVSDTGAGIPAEHVPQLFDRFYRADRSRNRATGGTGLGLAITKALVEMHQGTITVTSQVGQGTTFTFTLPVVSSYN